MPRKLPILAAAIILVIMSANCKVGYRRTSPCKLVPLKIRRVIRAQTIFTGIVRSVYRQPPGYRFLSAKVRVKTVYRGDPGLEGQTVVVDGLGNPKICVSRCPANAARVFFVMDKGGRRDKSRHSPPRYKLVSSLLRLTSANQKALTRIRASKRKSGNNLHCFIFKVFT